MRHFSTMTAQEVKGMIEACKDAAIAYSDKIGLSGLSEGGSHNVYRALAEAIQNEYMIAEGVRISKVASIPGKRMQVEAITWMPTVWPCHPDVDITVLIISGDGEMTCGSWDDEHETWWDIDGEPIDAVYWAVVAGPTE